MAFSKNITIFVAFVLILRSSLGAPLPLGAKALRDDPLEDIGFKRIGVEAPRNISFPSLTSFSNYAYQKLKQVAAIIRDVKLSALSAEMNDEYGAKYTAIIPTVTPEPGLENVFDGWRPKGEYDGSETDDKGFIPYLYHVARTLMPTSALQNDIEGKKGWAPLKFLREKTVALLVGMGCLGEPVIEKHPYHSADEENKKKQAQAVPAKRPATSMIGEIFVTPTPMPIEANFAAAQSRTLLLGTESKLYQNVKVAPVEYKRVSSSSRASVECGHHHLTPAEIGDLLGPVPSPDF